MTDQRYGKMRFCNSFRCPSTAFHTVYKRMSTELVQHSAYRWSSHRRHVANSHIFKMVFGYIARLSQRGGRRVIYLLNLLLPALRGGFTRGGGGDSALWSHHPLHRNTNAAALFFSIVLIFSLDSAETGEGGRAWESRNDRGLRPPLVP
jgi:hypothetical protein